MSEVKKWTQEEDEFMIQNDGELTDKELAELMGRTVPAIQMRRNKLRTKGKYEGYKAKNKEGKKMNVAYDQINCADAARIIKVDYSTMVGWCRKGIINCINVCEGTKNARYLLEEDEVDYIRDLVKKFGARKAMLWYRKDKSIRYPKEKPEIVQTDMDVSVVNTENRLEQVMPKVEPPKMEVTFTVPKSEKETLLDKMTRTLMYIQDIKERLDDIEAEKNQLLSELKECQEEVMGYIGVKGDKK